MVGARGYLGCLFTMVRRSLARIRTLLKLTRVWNLLIIVLAQYTSVLCLIPAEPARTLNAWGVTIGYGDATWSDPVILLLAVSTCLIAAAGYAINDYFDVKIDLINKPERVVVGRNLSRRKAMMMHLVFSGAGIVLGAALGWNVALVHLLSAVLLWWYSAGLKRGAFGNVAIALLTAASLLVIYLPYRYEGRALGLYAAFAFVMTLVREVVKDMEDVRGDQAYGCRTLPIRWGIARTKVYAGTLVLSLMAAVVAVHVKLMPLPVNYFLALVMLPLGLFSYQLMKADTVREFHRLSQWSKYILVLGVLSMFVL